MNGTGSAPPPQAARTHPLRSHAARMRFAPARGVPATLLSAALLAGALGATGPASAEDAPADEEDAPVPCSAPEIRQFDFWVGTWDLTWDGGTGTNVIDRLYDGCVVREQFDGGDFQGTSLSTWDPRAGLWRQTWVDSEGAYLDFTGGMEGDRMILSRVAHLPKGDVRQRMVFYGIQPDSFTWDWEVSHDDGKTWELRWRIYYRRRE